MMWIKKIYRFIRKRKFLKGAFNVDKSLVLLENFSISGKTEIIIDKNVYIGSDVWIDGRGGLYIGEGTIFGPRVKIHTVNHRYENAKFLPYDEVFLKKKVIILENVWIGSDVIILPGARINEGVVVSSGSVVVGELKKCGVYGGNPAKLIKERKIDLYEKLKKEEKIYMKYKNNQKIL